MSLFFKGLELLLSSLFGKATARSNDSATFGYPDLFNPRRQLKQSLNFTVIGYIRLSNLTMCLFVKEIAPTGHTPRVAFGKAFRNKSACFTINEAVLDDDIFKFVFSAHGSQEDPLRSWVGG